MISVIKKTFLILSLCVVSLHSQSGLEDQFDIAKKHFCEENYFDAVTEFKRLLFFDEQKEYSFTANYYIAGSYKAGGKFSEAIKHFTLAEISAKSIDDIYKSKIEIIKLNILRRTTNKAKQLIDNLFVDNRFANKSDELHYWKGWAYIFSNQWEGASEEFYKINPDHELVSFTGTVNDSLYDETLAKVLSYLIPGAGQFHTGEYLSGFLSLGWNVLWGYLTINSFIEERVFDGFVTANFLWFRFYNGNIQNAEKFVSQKNLEITNRALDYLQFQYPGKKP